MAHNKGRLVVNKTLLRTRGDRKEFKRRKKFILKPGFVHPFICSFNYVLSTFWNSSFPMAIFCRLVGKKASSPSLRSPVLFFSALNLQPCCGDTIPWVVPPTHTQQGACLGAQARGQLQPLRIVAHFY